MTVHVNYDIGVNLLECWSNYRYLQCNLCSLNDYVTEFMVNIYTNVCSIIAYIMYFALICIYYQLKVICI